MAINAVDKIKIVKYLKENPVGEIYYLDLCDALGKRGKIEDIEFLEFFVESCIKEFNKNVKISMKYVTKLVCTIDSFLGWVHEDGIEIEEILLDKIRSLEEYYDDYLNRNEFDIDLEFTDGCLKSLLESVNYFYPKEEKSESVVQYLVRIDELEKELENLKREYSDIVQRFDSLKEKLDKQSIEFGKKSSELARNVQLVENKNKDIEKLNVIINSLNENIESLECSLNSVRSENIELTLYKGKYEEILCELEKVKSEVDSMIKAKEEAILKENVDKEVESLIYRKLIVEQANINDILDYLDKEGYSLSKNEVYNMLSRMKSKINLVNSSFSLSPSYKIVAPKVMENGIFDIGIPMDTKVYDILLVSDFHLREMNDKVLSSVSNMYEYCSNHGISLIMNLGDFYDHLLIGDRFENACSNYRLVEKSISLLPRCDGIYQAILGGNHDEKILRYGFDPIDMLTHEREDFINLGYRHCTITLNGSKSVCNSFDLHHPSGMFFDLSLGDDGVASENILGYLNQLYEGIGRNRNDSFVDLFGHTHKSQYNFMDSYCFIPAFFEGKNKRGACHLKIYLDEDTQIKYMVFMPLSINDKFIKQNEIVYQKVLSR